MSLDKLALGGLTVVAIGWAFLVSGLVVAGTNVAPTPLLAVDLSALAHALILSGFGLAVLGILKSGFSALDRVFRTAAAPPRTPQPVPERPMYLGDRAPSKPVAERPPVLPKKVVERGRLRDRAYTLFMDGSVEIETLLGLRQFPSLEEAQDFIG